MPRKQRPEPPTGDNPLAETTMQRRMWALRVAKGWSRYHFAAQMGVSYTTVDQWDLGDRMPTVDHTRRAADVLGVDLRMLIVGLGEHTDPVLPLTAIHGVLGELDATPEERMQLGEFYESPGGRFQDWTRLYVIGWVQTYRGAREAGASPEEARGEAIDGGARMAATAAAAIGGGRLVSEAELKADAAEHKREHVRDEPRVMGIARAAASRAKALPAAKLKRKRRRH